MNFKSLFKTYWQWLIHFMRLQLFLSLMSLPIMLAWGLPLSLLSPLGNLIFGPVLTLFLLLCSLIFFAELLMIPNSLFISALETVRSWWLTIMFSDQHRFLIGFSKPSIIILCSIPIITIMIMLNKRTAHGINNIGYLLVLFFSITCALKYTSSTSPALLNIPCNNGTITLITASDELILIDPGFMGQRTSASSWVCYTLIPTLIKTTGKTVINHCIILQPSVMLFEAIETLSTKVTIKNLYIPYWYQHEPSRLARAFCSCTTTAQEHGATIVRIGQVPSLITLRNANPILIKPLEALVTTKNCSYPAFSIATSVDNQNITLYSAKYAKKQISSSTWKHNNPLIPRVDNGNQ